MVLNEFFNGVVLPFLLVFLVIYAVLQKSKILGDEMQKVNSMVALVIGLIFIGFPGPRGMVVEFMPWLAVGLAVMLVFFILYGFVAGDLSGTNMPNRLKYTFGILAGVFTIGVVLYVTGLGSVVYDWFGGRVGNGWITNVVVFVVIVGAVLFVVFGKSRSSSPSS